MIILMYVIYLKIDCYKNHIICDENGCTPFESTKVSFSELISMLHQQKMTKIDVTYK